MSKNKNKDPETPVEILLKRLIEITEKDIMINLYLAGANKEEIKSVLSIGSDKANKIISTLKSLKRGK